MVELSQLDVDANAVRHHRDGMRDILQFMQQHADTFPTEAGERRLLSTEEKTLLFDAWNRMLDYQLALEHIKQNHKVFYKIKNKATRRTSEAILFAAFLTQYRYALEFIHRIENNPSLDALLNDTQPEYGIPAGTYADFKFRYLNLDRAAEFTALAAVYEASGKKHAGNLRTGISEDARYLWKAGVSHGPKLTAKNGIDIVTNAAFSVWFPVQTNVATWMGDTKVYRKDEYLISDQQIADLGDRLQPGDILLERREWHVSNVGLPGFWPHAAFFIGTTEQRRDYFDDDSVHAWVKTQGQGDGDFENLLKTRYPEAYADSLSPQEDGHIPRIIEAIGEGVSFTTLEHSAYADSVAALRPRLDKVTKAAAILKTFHYSGRPYDFNFDFQTDSSLVCTELVYKSYEPDQDKPGLTFPVKEVMGRLVTAPNDIARMFDEQHGSEQQQLDLVAFLDADEFNKHSSEASEAEFRNSWQRPKWHILKGGLKSLAMKNIDPSAND